MCAISLCVGKIGLGWAHDVFTLHVTCSCIIHAFVCLFTYSYYCELCWSFSDCFFLSPLYLLVTLVVFMALKRKSIPARNPLHSSASTSSDHAPFSLRFCNDDAHKAFTKNFSRRGIHLERRVILGHFADTNLPTITHSREWIRFVTSPSLVLSYWFRSSTPTCMGLTASYLILLLGSKVFLFLSHHSLLRMCLGFLGYCFPTILPVSVWGLCPRMSSCLLSVSVLLCRVSTNSLTTRPLQKVHGFWTWSWPLYYIPSRTTTPLRGLVLISCYLFLSILPLTSPPTSFCLW